LEYVPLISVHTKFTAANGTLVQAPLIGTIAVNPATNITASSGNPTQLMCFLVQIRGINLIGN